MPEATVARFRGTVRCRREPHGPLGLTLSGLADDRSGDEVQLAFAAAAPPDLPERLEDALIERGEPGEYRIVSAARSWPIAARSVHVHREIAERFYRAIPPRPAPLMRRMLFGAMLALARSRVGIALLKALRG
jgi:hypothetical protein